MAKLHPSNLAQRFAAWPRVARIAGPVVLGALAALGHESWATGFWWVTIPFILALLSLPAASKKAASFGWLLGVGYFAVTLRWIVEPFLVDPVRHGWMAPFAILFLSGGLALFWGAAFWLARWFSVGRANAMLWLPITLTLAELMRGHVFTGFPWGLPSYTLIGGVGDVWFAWVGPYGTTLLLLGLIGVVAYSLHRGWTLIWPALVGCLFATLGLQALTPQAPEPNRDVTLRLVQPNAPQHQKWDRDWMPVFFERAIAQTSAGDPPDVVIWPETSIPSLLNYAQPLIERMSIAARGAPVVAGIQREDANAYFNSAIVIEGPTTVGDIMDKAHLVPFGEYIPLAHVLVPLGLGTLVEQVAGFTAGQGDGLMEIDGFGLARVLICYEGIFPEEIQRGDVRPDVLLILTNDAWFGTNAGPRQHLVQAQARAIEQGLPVIRAANTGISAVIDARGEIVDSLPLNEAGYLDAHVPNALPPTAYAQIGDWPLLVLLGLFFLLGLVRRRVIAVDPLVEQG
ncbi:apolipoprotein N-acyltransferase [Octadecabacter sp. 1_MG-2023]|uniref:apolipoprotein N-acyltransferase n=1 Tax=unclassified Octadecabacter TaxID=196158 RepID=UPI001C0A441F|nr:apolipoprotein N-acyltransferase [Octadecabacter sp. 1_MG-2023]MBU2994547.1 apolipoprotein N-acyltransferase [Octadecabacter sp. B2R22]MDO6734160.1 apolipoprotein N-acyltransferase [Octadecabacter sp. 1_MG-2023]